MTFIIKFVEWIMRKIYMELLNKATIKFDSLPKPIQKFYVKRYCSVACQLVAKRDNTKIVLLVKVAQTTSDYVEDHYMNVDHQGQWFYDWYGNRIKAEPVGRFISFGHGVYFVDEIVDKWSDFGYTSVIDRCEKISAKNNELWRVYGPIVEKYQ